MPAACLAKRSRFTYPDNVQKMAHRMKLSIVATLYCSAPELPEFYRRCVAAAKEVTDDLEIILVDDGSPDDSLAVALSLQASDHRVVVVELARNFGHHKAMMTGLAHSAGDLVFLIDSDLEEPPEALTAFHAKLTDGGWDVVYGIQRERRGSPFERLTGRAFYAIMDALSDRSIPRDLITARLMRRDYVAALIAHQDRSFQISHLWALTGFRQAALEVEKLNEVLPYDDFLGKGSITVTEFVSGSPSLCAVADYAKIHLDRRLTWGETKESAVAEIQYLVKDMDAEIRVLHYEETAYTGFRYGMEKYYPTWKIAEGDPLVVAAKEAYSSLFKEQPKVDKWTFSTNGVTINGMYDIPCIGFGPGNEVFAHAPDEKVPVSDLVAASAFYAILAYYL